MSEIIHRLAVSHAVASVNKLGQLFDALGSKSSPTAGMWGAYATARDALDGRLSDPRSVKRTLAALRDNVMTIAESNLSKSLRAGERQAAAELRIYDIAPIVSDQTEQVLDQYLASVGAAFDAQAQRVNALLLSGSASLDLIAGDSVKPGILRASGLVEITTAMLTAILLYGYDSVLNGSLDERRNEFVRQAVAAIDERTTDCCLRVHGQTVLIDGLFHLTGIPRYADYLPSPPFHNYCRTGVCMVLASDADDIITSRMRSAASAELLARADGSRKVIHPANAFSGRQS